MQALFRWAPGLGMLAAACGGSSDLSGLDTSPSTFGGAPAAGGAFGGIARGGSSSVGGTSWGGTAIRVGGFPAVGGAGDWSCAIGNPCSTPGSYCVTGNMTCQCFNGSWGLCVTEVTFGGMPSFSGGRPSVSGGRPSVSGGTWSGGRATGGIMTGGTASGGWAGMPAVCTPSDVLPTMGTTCNSLGESRCDSAGGRCVCAGSWYCDAACDATRVPTPNTACTGSLACNYPTLGLICSCIDSRWICAGASSCPAGVPTTGNDCTGLTNVLCDYPGSVHLGCACLADSAGSSWLCITLTECPASPPVYPATCAGPSLCTYGSLRCGCLQAGTPWTCA